MIEISRLVNRQRLQILAGILIGFGIWVSSPVIVGQIEPWDAEWPYYVAVMVVAGALLELVQTRRKAFVFISLWAGQCIALLLPPHQIAWYFVGATTASLGSMLGLVGAILVSATSFAWHRLAP